MLIKILLVFVFFGIMLGVGFYARRHATDVNGFVLGGRSVGPWLTAFAYGTSYFSAVVFVGYAGQFGYKYGLSSTWIGIGNALLGSLLAWVILGRRTRVMSKSLHAKTMPDYFGKRYKSRALRITAAMISFVFLIPYTASVYKGLSGLFQMAFDIPYEYCVIAMALLTCVYVLMGGYMATAINDFIQGIIMIFGIVAVVVAVLSGHGGFFGAVKELAGVSVETTMPLSHPGGFVSFFGPDPLNLLGVVILTSLGTWGLPQMVGKFYAIKDERAVKTGTIISTAFAAIVAGGCYFLGGFGRLVDPAKVTGADGKIVFDSVIPQMLSGLPDILIGIVVVLVLSASMSTLSSLVLTSSSTLTLDLLKGNIIKKMSDKHQLLWMRILLVFFVLVSVGIALDPPAFIAQLMGISWGALAGAFLAPFLYGLYWKGVTKAAVWASFISGVGITVANMIFKFIESPINAGAITMVVGLVVVPVVSLITPRMNRSEVDDIFRCYRTKVTVEQKIALSEDDESTEAK